MEKLCISKTFLKKARVRMHISHSEATPALGLSLSYEMMEDLLLFKF